MKTKSEQYIYEHLEKEYSNSSIQSDSINELYDDLKEQVQRNIKKSISRIKNATILQKQMIQFRTNEWNLESRKTQRIALERTLSFFDKKLKF